MTAKNKGRLYIFVAAALMSTGGLFIKSVSASAFTIAFFRALVAVLVFLPFIQWKKIKLTGSFVGLVVSYIWICLGFVTATTMTTAANAIILQCSAPLWLYLGYVIIGKRPVVARELWPRLAILAGILLIFFKSGGGGDDPRAAIGNLIALSTGVGYALEQFFLERDYGMSAVSTVGLLNVGMVIFMGLCLFPFIHPAQLDLKDIGLLIFLGVFQLAIPYVIFTKGVRLASAIETSVLSLLEPILNPILVLVFLGEVPGIFTVLGYVAIFAGIILTIFVPVQAPEAETPLSQ